MIISCVEVGGGFDHLLILLQIYEHDSNPSSPFKFNISWLDYEELLKLKVNAWGMMKLQRNQQVISFQKP